MVSTHAFGVRRKSVSRGAVTKRIGEDQKFAEPDGAASIQVESNVISFIAQEQPELRRVRSSNAAVVCIYDPNASTNLKKSAKSTAPLPSRSKRESVPPYASA